MNILFFTIFILFPVAEVMVFISFWDEIGFFATILLLFLMTAIGIGLVRHEGTRTLFELQNSLHKGAMPDEQVFNACCIALAGVLMVLPGFISDFLGFLLLVPQVRAHIHTALARKAQPKPDSGIHTGVIEGEYETIDE